QNRRILPHSNKSISQNLPILPNNTKNMASLLLNIKEPKKKTKKILLELDAEKFERLAANFGFFNYDFIKSLHKAEQDYKLGNVKKINSLKDLRK
ncbi:MAG: hypothetical protein V1860_00640, partial [bacterium]